MGYNDFEPMVGKTITDALINQNRDVMMWKVDGVWYSLNAYGDCCSDSWFEHCDNALVFDNAKFLEYENVGGDSWEDNYNLIQVNMIKVKTDKGHCTIEFRNSSNGYYSGWVEVREEPLVMEPGTEFKKIVDF